MRIFGLLLIAVGVVVLAYQGFSYVTRDTIVDAGPVRITADHRHYVWVPPVLGAAAVIGGALLILGSSPRNYN